MLNLAISDANGLYWELEVAEVIPPVGKINQGG